MMQSQYYDTSEKEIRFGDYWRTDMEYSEDDLLGLINGDDPEKENLSNELDEKLNDIDRVLDVSVIFNLNNATLDPMMKGIQYDD